MAVQINKGLLIKALERVIYKTYYAEIVKNTPGKGIVADAWGVTSTPDSIIIYNNEYGEIINFLEYGTKPTIIRAKNKKFLRFEKPKEPRKSTYKRIPGNQAFEKDGYIFAKAVNHPGIEARMFIHKVIEDPKIATKFEEELEKEIKKLLI